MRYPSNYVTVGQDLAHETTHETSSGGDALSQLTDWLNNLGIGTSTPAPTPPTPTAPTSPPAPQPQSPFRKLLIPALVIGGVIVVLKMRKK